MLLSYKWCDNCSNPTPGAVNVCNSGCGQKFVSKCIPLMRSYGEKEDKIRSLRAKIKDLQAESKRFQDYQKAKKELEYQDIKLKKSSTFSNMDHLFLNR